MKFSEVLRYVIFLFCTMVTSAFAADLPKAIQGTYSSINYKIVEGGSEKAGLGDELTVKVEKLQSLVLQATNSKKKITLYLNGMALRGVNPISINCASGELRFKLIRTEESKESWGKLLGKPGLLNWQRPVTVGLGFGQDNECPQVLDKTVTLVIIKNSRALFWAIFAGAVLILFAIYAPKSAALRNYGPTSPYSLALVQMVFWTGIVLFSYIFLWLVTGECNTIPESVLVLLGIATGTSLGARVIDANKENSRAATRKSLQVELDKLPPEPADEATKKQRETLIGMIKEIEDKRDPQSTGFINDILADVNGISLHRIQMLVWTLTFGFIFIYKVYHDLAMPVFDATQLALIGISSGTYLGFKLPEQH